MRTNDLCFDGKFHSKKSLRIGQSRVDQTLPLPLLFYFLQVLADKDGIQLRRIFFGRRFRNLAGVFRRANTKSAEAV